MPWSPANGMLIEDGATGAVGWSRSATSSERHDCRLAFRNGRSGELVGVSHTEISRIELASAPRVPYQTLAVIGAVLGLDISIRAFPNGEPIRDAAQVALLGRLRTKLPSSLRWRTEVPIRLPDDRRAWDAEILGPGWRVALDAESRLRDVQALSRRVALKARDDGADIVILLVAGTRHNRHVVRLAAPDLAGMFPVPGRSVLAALEAGTRPEGSGIVLI